MKEEPLNQKQHKIPQVYLKQFGYEVDKKWLLSVSKKGESKTENISIVEFMRETNIFDLPFNEPELKRHFENSSNKIENEYRTVISNLENQKRITDKNRGILNHFVANLLCRTDSFRLIIENYLRCEVTRDKFINEMTMFSDNSFETKKFLELFKMDYQLNVVIGTLMNHLVHVFRRFKKVIIKDYDDLEWLTSDNPVIIDKQGHDEWILPLESEIYLPLSRRFCLFMYNDSSKIKINPLRNLKVNVVNKIDFETYDRINWLVTDNVDNYLIFNNYLEETDLSK